MKNYYNTKRGNVIRMKKYNLFCLAKSHRQRNIQYVILQSAMILLLTGIPIDILGFEMGSIVHKSTGTIGEQLTLIFIIN